MKSALSEIAHAQLDDNPTSPSGEPAIAARYRLPVMGTAIVLLLLALVWAIWSISSGIEFRAFGQRLHNGDTGKLKTPVLAQSFLSPNPNLSRIELQLTGAIPISLPQDVQIKLMLGEGLEGTAVYDAPLSAARVISDAGESYLSIVFPALSASEGQTYTLALITPGYSVNSFMQTGYAPIDAYSSGQLYTEDGPQPGDLAITGYYRYSLPMLIADTAGTVAGQLPTIVVWLLLLLLPGLALLAWLPNNLSAGQRLLAAPAITALTLPIFYLYANLAGIQIGALTLWVLLALCTLALAVRLFLANRKSQIAIRIPHSAIDWAFWGTLAVVLAITAITRLLSLRGMAAGMGLDAYHHTLITEMFVRDGGIPGGYEPYGPLQSFTYHFGFHGLTAALAWLTGNTSPTSIMSLMPQVGQIAGSVLPIPALTLYGWRVLNNRWLGLAAGALTGLVSVVPAFYVEWSRYTQGLGLALLPVAWVLLLEATKDEGRKTKDDDETERSSQPAARSSKQSVFHIPYSAIVLAVIGAAGLFLTHYRITMIYAGFVALYPAWRCVSAFWEAGTLKSRLMPPLAEAVRAGIVGITSLAMLLPWLLNLNQNFVKNFIDRDGLDLDVYFATAERLGADVLNHPSLPILSVLCALALTIFGWKETRKPRLGAAIGASAGLVGVIAAFYIFLNPSQLNMEHDLQTLLLGLSPVAWVLMIEIAAFGLLVWLAKDKGVLLVLPTLVWLILALWSSPQLLPFRLPYVGYLDAVTLASVAWLPAALLGGYALVNGGAWVWRTMKADNTARMPLLRAIGWLATTTTLVVGLAAGLSLAPVNDRKPYVAQADLEALTWMRDNLPPESYVLANSFTFPWSPNQAVGLDAGLWIPLLSDLRASVPPITVYNERPSDPLFFDRVRALIPITLTTDNPADWQTLKEAGITHIFIGSRAGDAGFSAQQLLQNGHVKLVYHNEAVWLFLIL